LLWLFWRWGPRTDASTIAVCHIARITV
jgi:hypothetical protein